MMFSVRQKRAIAEAVQRILRETNHPELPTGEIQFHLHVRGATHMSWADIRNNGAVGTVEPNAHNELMDPQQVPHEYGPSTVGHGNSQCKWCRATDLENQVISPNHCATRAAKDPAYAKRQGSGG